MERPPRPPRAVRDELARPTGEFVPGHERAEAESLSVAFGYMAESERREFAGYTMAVTNPTDEYFAWLADRLAEAGVSVRIGQTPGTRALVGPIHVLSAETIAAVKVHGDGLVGYLKRCRGLKEPDRTQQPPPFGAVIEVVDAAGNYSVRLGETLGEVDWVRWRYRKQKRWHAFTGESWEE
jgi:hypothetical protein